MLLERRFRKERPVRRRHFSALKTRAVVRKARPALLGDSAVPKGAGRSKAFPPRRCPTKNTDTGASYKLVTCSTGLPFCAQRGSATPRPRCGPSPWPVTLGWVEVGCKYFTCCRTSGSLRFLPGRLGTCGILVRARGPEPQWECQIWTVSLRASQLVCLFHSDWSA